MSSLALAIPVTRSMPLGNLVSLRGHAVAKQVFKGFRHFLIKRTALRGKGRVLPTLCGDL